MPKIALTVREVKDFFGTFEVYVHGDGTACIAACRTGRAPATGINTNGPAGIVVWAT
jgi:hypothetical protein